MSLTYFTEKKYRLIAVWAVLFLLLGLEQRLSLHAAANEPSVTVRLENPTIFLGESALLVVSVGNYENTPELDLSPLEKDFNAVKLGASQRSSVRSTGFGSSGLNFQREYSVDFQVRLTPKKSGTFTIPSPIVNVDGKRLVGEETQINVKGETQTDLVALEIATSPKEATYPLVPITITVSVYFKEASGKYQQYDPLSLCNTPALTIPWLDAASFNDAFIPDAPLEEWLGALRNRDYGFALNNYRSDPFDDFGSSFLFGSRQTYFMPKPERVQRKDAKGEDAYYWKYEFKRRVRPAKATKFTLEPVTLKGTYYDFADPENPQPEPFFLRSQSIVVNTKDVPDDAPENYIGVYGVVSQNLDVSATSLAVGEAATLTLEYRGYGSFDSAKAPDLEQIPGFADSFKTYPPTERSLDDGVAFEYKVRPVKPGDLTLPKIETSYFNVESGKFESLASDEVSFQVSGTAAPQENKPDVQGRDAADDSASSDSDDEAPIVSKSALKKTLFGCGALLAIAALIFALRAAVRVRKAKIQESDRRFANDARQKLKDGLALFASSPNGGIALIRLAFLQLVGKQFHQRVDSITDAELDDFFTRKFDGQSDEETTATINQMRDFFKRLERYRFAGGAFDQPDFENAAETLLDKWILLLQKKMKKLANSAVVFRESEK